MADSLDAETAVDDFLEDRYLVFILTNLTRFINNISRSARMCFFCVNLVLDSNGRPTRID